MALRAPTSLARMPFSNERDLGVSSHVQCVGAEGLPLSCPRCSQRVAPKITTLVPTTGDAMLSCVLIAQVQHSRPPRPRSTPTEQNNKLKSLTLAFVGLRIFSIRQFPVRSMAAEPPPLCAVV